MTIDYEEMVELWTFEETAGVRQPVIIDEMPLWRAVRTVIDVWGLGSKQQKQANIIRAHGASLMDLGAIQAVYDLEDFPAKRDRGLSRSKHRA